MPCWHADAGAAHHLAGPCLAAVAGGRAEHPDRPAIFGQGRARDRRPDRPRRAAPGAAAAVRGAVAAHRPGADLAQPLRPPRRADAAPPACRRAEAGLRRAAGAQVLVRGAGHRPGGGRDGLVGQHRDRRPDPALHAGPALEPAHRLRHQRLALGRLHGRVEARRGRSPGASFTPAIPATRPTSAKSAAASARWICSPCRWAPTCRATSWARST
jgi:hypothetical protein